MFGIFIYSLLLLFMVPAHVVAYRKVVTGRPLGRITNAIVTRQLRLTAHFKRVYWPVFYTLHILVALVALEIGALLSVALLLTYLVIVPMLQKQLRQRNWHIVPTVPASAVIPPPLP